MTRQRGVAPPSGKDGELFADCKAGAWMHWADARQVRGWTAEGVPCRLLLEVGIGRGRKQIRAAIMLSGHFPVEGGEIVVKPVTLIRDAGDVRASVKRGSRIMHEQSRDVERPAELSAQALRSVLLEHGRRVGQTPRLVRALLSDELGVDAHSARAYVDALVIAAEEGVPHDLVTTSDLGRDAAEAARVALRAEGGLSESMAAFAVSAWASALGRSEPMGTSPADATVAASAPFTSQADRTGPAAASPVEHGSVPPRSSTSPGGSGGTPTPWPTGSVAEVDHGTRAASAASANSYVGDKPSRHAGVRARLVGAAVAAAAVLVLVILVWSGSRSILGGSGEGVTAGSHAGHGGASGSSDAGGGKGQPPMQMPSATAVPSTVMAAVTATAGVDDPQLAPTGDAVGTPPVAIKSNHPTLAAVPQERSVQLQLTSSDQPGCAEVTGQQDLRWCELAFDVSAKGTVKDWRITDVALVEQHGKATVHGHSIHYQPFHNGAFVEHITYRLVGEGVRSGVGVIRIHAACNTNYVCH